MIILLFYQGHLKKAADITKAVGKVILIKYCSGLFFVPEFEFGPVDSLKFKTFLFMTILGNI